MFKIKRLIASAAVLITAAAFSAGQQQRDGSCLINSTCQQPKITRQYDLVGLGTAGADPAALNMTLRSMGLAGFDTYGASLNYSRHAEFNRFMVEGSVAGLFWDDAENDTLKATLMAGNLSGNIGVSVLPAGRSVSLWPFVGIGLGANRLHIRSKNKTLNQALASLEPNVTVVQAEAIIHAGLAVDVVFPSRDNAKGLVIGLRGGYMFAPATSRWYMDGDMPVTGIPGLQQRGPFLRIVLGGWLPKRHHHDCCPAEQ